MHPRKEAAFRNEYFELTGEPLLLDGKSHPFYIWGDDVNKYGIQLRVYFRGDNDSTPDELGKVPVRPGRTAGTLRINSGKFVRALFEAGFLLGKTTEPVNIKANVPRRFIRNFNRGFNMISPLEEMEKLVRKHCERQGSRTVAASVLESLWNKRRHKAGDLLKTLHKKKIVARNDKHNAYTLLQTNLHKGVENKKLQQTINEETNLDKKEILIETWARDYGWVKLAKQIFGTNCMINECKNMFLKQDGIPYIEVHHIKPLYKGGEDGIWNLAVLCAHHHRMAHFADDKTRRSMSRDLRYKNKSLCKAPEARAP